MAPTAPTRTRDSLVLGKSRHRFACENRSILQFGVKLVVHAFVSRRAIVVERTFDMAKHVLDQLKRRESSLLSAEQSLHRAQHIDAAN